jgi:REP element-mobilizing transposase RayT
MSRSIRFIPAGSTVEVTSRTLEGRLLLTPSPELNTIIEGCLAFSGEVYQVDIHAYAFLSNHFHLLLTVRDAKQLAEFMGHFKSKLAREVNTLRGRRQALWGNRYAVVVVSGEEAAQVGRLRYILSHGCKEGLVARPQDWPGVHASRTLAHYPQAALRGVWIDRTAGWRNLSENTAATRKVELALKPLPCWQALDASQVQARIGELLTEIEAETRQMHRRNKTRPVGRETILRQNPASLPRSMKRSPLPRFHAVAKAVRQGLESSLRAFLLAYRQAADRLRRGDLRVEFPPGSFPPTLPFVGLPARASPG